MKHPFFIQCCTSGQRIEHTTHGPITRLLVPVARAFCLSAYSPSLSHVSSRLLSSWTMTCARTFLLFRCNRLSSFLSLVCALFLSQHLAVECTVTRQWVQEEEQESCCHSPLLLFARFFLSPSLRLWKLVSLRTTLSITYWKLFNVILARGYKNLWGIVSSCHQSWCYTSERMSQLLIIFHRNNLKPSLKLNETE